MRIYTKDQICGSQTAWNPCFCPDLDRYSVYQIRFFSDSPH